MYSSYDSSDGGGHLQQSSSLLVVGVTLFLSVAIEFLPWPGVFLPYKPIFPMLMLVYWIVHHAKYINYAAAMCLGILLDLANQTPLGFNALSAIVTVLIINMLSRRFILLTGVSQSLNVFFAFAAGQYCLYLLGFLEDNAEQPPLRWTLFIPSASAAVLWLFLPIFIRNLQRLVFGLRGMNSDA